MELAEPIDRINLYLQREFGVEPDGSPRWRVVLAGEQLEKRKMTHTDEGFELLWPEVREVRKYQHIDREKYVLERQVPVVGETDLITKTSFEPAWTFEDRFGNWLPPRFDACKVVIEAIFSQIENAGLHKEYKDPDATPEARQKKLDDMEYKLFGNETPVGDALAHKYGVTDFHQKVDFSEEKKQ